MLVENGALLSLDRQKGFAGLKTVLGNNKKTREAMPKSVSDMFVATRSTQCLDELINDDLLPYAMTWSTGEDNSTDTYGGMTSDQLSKASAVNSFPFSGTTNSICSSIAATSIFNGHSDSCGDSNMSNTMNSSGTKTSSSMASQNAGGDAEFSSFPSDDADESFIPFEQTSCSKFGPISRMSKVKTNNTALVQVTADLKEDPSFNSSTTPQSCKIMTPVLAVTPMERPLSTSVPVPSRFPCPPMMESFGSEPSVKPTPSEIPSAWQRQISQSPYSNITHGKAGSVEAMSHERLAFELQAIELEIALKTGKEPEPVRKLLQDAVMSSSQVQADLYGNNHMSVLGHGHITDCLMGIEGGENLISSQKAAQHFMEDYYRSWQGIKK